MHHELHPLPLPENSRRRQANVVGQGDLYNALMHSDVLFQLQRDLFVFDPNNLGAV
ncbi:hypothetical protein CERSUDRAFT_68884 [Gelatoporia subvermispora B]|uniref:Uncharacterized protein n=1 Tax=Ceriporiopsis subvermispora (strain B) TaxID=914234 RepID=M2QIV5_CERS8|nr:hypothetical protein CERSUDRAFT_68884 [Gelatoporia subvermispora B]